MESKSTDRMSLDIQNILLFGHFSV